VFPVRFPLALSWLSCSAAGKTKQNFTRLGFTVRQFYPFVLSTTVFDTASLPGGIMSIETSVKAAELSTLNHAFLVPHVAHVVSSFKCLLFVSACSRLQNWQSRNLQGEHGQLGWQLRGAEGSLLEGDSSEEPFKFRAMKTKNIFWVLKPWPRKKTTQDGLSSKFPVTDHVERQRWMSIPMHHE
jgi:hypothetical protein